MNKVMIVDDEPNIRKGLSYLINWEKYNFTISSLAKNGKDAIEKMNSSYPDLVITDIKMPGMDGLSLIKHVRKNMHDNNMIFIILSGYDEFEYAKEAIQYNVRSYLLKPIDERELVNILNLIDKDLQQKKPYNFFYNKKVENFSEQFYEIKEFKKLIDAIENNNSTSILNIIDDIFSTFNDIFLHPRFIKIHLDNFIITLSNIVSNMDGNIHDIIKKYSFFKSDISSLNMDKLKDSLTEFCLEISSYTNKLKKSCGVVNKVKKYVDENYSENIRLKDIAQKHYINTAYLGQLFKKETDLNFTQYLNQIRIENAKKLLKRTDLHIYQIAEKVGYKNSDYFIIRFKESENCTPMEYKTRKIQNF